LIKITENKYAYEINTRKFGFIGYQIKHSISDQIFIGGQLTAKIYQEVIGNLQQFSFAFLLVVFIFRGRVKKYSGNSTHQERYENTFSSV
jgi:hypothetical protein